MFRSNPGPSCQKRKQNLPGLSRTVNFFNKGASDFVSRPLTCFENGCFNRARYRPITRKGQLVEVTRLVKMPDLFTMGLIYGHVEDCTKSMTAENENVCHWLCQC